MSTTTLAAVYFIIGIIGTKIFEIFTHEKRVYWFGRHIHHSNWGLFFIVIGILLNSVYTIIFVSFGLGIIVQHTVAERELVFID